MISRLFSLARLLRHRGPRTVWDVVINRPMVSFRDGNTRYHMANDSAATYHLLNSVEKMRRLAAEVEPSARVVVDIGAHSGLFSCFAAERAEAATIIAIEPDPGLRSSIESNLSRVADAQIIASAVSDQPGIANLYRNPESTQTNSLLRTAVEAFSPAEPIETIPVDVTTLDEVWREVLDSNRIDVLKIDVQGAEFAVIAGAREALSHVATLLIEVSFLDPDASNLLVALQQVFGPPEVVNLVSGGADLKYQRRSSLGSAPPTNG